MTIPLERFSLPERNKLRHRARRGTAAVEYAVVLALIVVVCIGNLRLLGSNSARTYQAISQALGSGGISSNPGPPANAQARP